MHEDEDARREEGNCSICGGRYIQWGSNAKPGNA
jgi:hypothetical protein